MLGFVVIISFYVLLIFLSSPISPEAFSIGQTDVLIFLNGCNSFLLCCIISRKKRPLQLHSNVWDYFPFFFKPLSYWTVEGWRSSCLPSKSKLLFYLWIAVRNESNRASNYRRDVRFQDNPLFLLHVCSFSRRLLSDKNSVSGKLLIFQPLLFWISDFRALSLNEQIFVPEL